MKKNTIVFIKVVTGIMSASYLEEKKIRWIPIICHNFFDLISSWFQKLGYPTATTRARVALRNATQSCSQTCVVL